MKRLKKIMFINPPQSVDIGTNYTNIKFPLGFIYMAGVLEENGFEVKILDCPLYYKYKRKIDEKTIRIGLFLDHIKESIEEFNPDIIGISCAYSMYESDSFEVIDFLKGNFKEKLIVVGGAHSSANPEYVLRNKNIDLVVIGEGEETMLEIAKKYSKNKEITNIPGTVLNYNGRIKNNGKREYIKDLDKLRPSWHLLDIKEYFRHPDNYLATMRKNSVDIITSRGCPGNCVFCSINTVWGRKWRARSIKNVVDEIEMLYNQYGARQFRFQDDNLTLDKKRIIKICKEIIHRELDIRWDTPNGIAIWTIDKDIILNMKKAGCYRVTFAIESACKNSQKYIQKFIDIKKIDGIIEYCHKIGMWVCATFVVGFPNETRAEINETTDYVLNSKINFPFFYIAQPYQGTKMYKDFKKYKLIKDEFISSSNALNTKYDSLHLKSFELNQISKNVQKRFYLKKIISYTNPITLYREFLSKIKTLEDLSYVVRMFKAILF